MSIIASGISYRHSHRPTLFENVTFIVADGAKVSLIGPNGAGKSTLLQLLAGRLTPATGSIVTSSHPYFIPQQTVPDGRSIAGLLGAADKLRALRAIYAGSVDPADFETLDDDWTIEERCRAALDEWGLRRVGPDTPAAALSGGERMRLMLCCLMLSNHVPDLFVLDEPTNNLDIGSLAILTDTLRNYRGTLLVISHDDRFVREIGATHTVELPLAPSEERP